MDSAELSRLFVVAEFVVWTYILIYFSARSCLAYLQQYRQNQRRRRVMSGQDPLALNPYIHRNSKQCTAGGGGGGGCAICLEEYKDGENCAAVITCKHRFHGGCIKEWLLDHATCPLCRALVV